jgi:hypothetical protein
LKTLDRSFGWLLVVGSLLHAMGVAQAYRSMPETLLWALSGTLAGLLLAALNLLRVGRPEDRSLAWVCVVGGLGWLAIVIAFGRLIGNLLDFRVLIQGVITLVLVGMSLRSALGGGAEELSCGRCQG